MNNSKCELCSSNANLNDYQVPPREESILLCQDCRHQIEGKEKLDVNHWHCLNESMWSEFPAVQVMAYRLLKQLREHSWAQDLLEQLYLEEDTLNWANFEREEGPETLDSNGNILQDGDKVALIKNLDVKGANFTAKRGTIVKKITLTEDTDLVEGRINGQQIVLKTCFLKKVQ